MNLQQTIKVSFIYNFRAKQFLGIRKIHYRLPALMNIGISAYFKRLGEKFVQKFIAKAKDYEVSSAKNMIEYLRLDYKGTGFKPNEGFAIIEFPYPGEIKIMHPFEVPNILVDNPAPYTNTGMSGSSRTIIPEYYLSERIELPQGTQLTIYDQAGSQIRQYVLKITSNSEGEKQLTWHIK